MRKFRVSAHLFGEAAVLMLTAPLAHAQDGGKMNHGGLMTGNGCGMKDGKMMMQGGKMKMPAGSQGDHRMQGTEM